MEFKPMPKVPRLSREVVITEKIDGTNASVFVTEDFGLPEDPNIVAVVGNYALYAGSRTRWITPENDNFGFAAWVRDNAEQLAKLGPGHHFGEWWGKGIQRGYGLSERRFSLFNVGRWRKEGVQTWHSVVGDERVEVPECCSVVPVVALSDVMDTALVEQVLREMQRMGSLAAPGFMDPEGIMVYHTAANQLFKKTIKGDEEGKHAEAHPPKVRPPKPPKDPSKGGRRVMQVEIAFPGRRKGDV